MIKREIDGFMPNMHLVVVKKAANQLFHDRYAVTEDADIVAAARDQSTLRLIPCYETEEHLYYHDGDIWRPARDIHGVSKRCIYDVPLGVRRLSLVRLRRVA